MKKKIQALSNTWINLAGKVVLINSILSSYAIFSCAFFLTTKGVINTFNMEIMKFLWKGGNTQGRKFNLVKWEVVLEEKRNGGLIIRDVGRMNKALGGELVWRMISREKDWWIKEIRKQYIKRKKSKLLDLP